MVTTCMHIESVQFKPRPTHKVIVSLWLPHPEDAQAACNGRVQAQYIRLKNLPIGVVAFLRVAEQMQRYIRQPDQWGVSPSSTYTGATHQLKGTDLHIRHALHYKAAITPYWSMQWVWIIYLLWKDFRRTLAKTFAGTDTLWAHGTYLLHGSCNYFRDGLSGITYA